MLLIKWKQQWKTEKSEWKLLKIKKFKYIIVKQHIVFYKIKNAIIIQIKINKINFTAFLNQTWMFRIKFFIYQCNLIKKIIIYVITYCSHFTEIKYQIANLQINQVNIKNFINSLEKIHKLIK